MCVYCCREELILEEFASETGKNVVDLIVTEMVTGRYLYPVEYATLGLSVHFSPYFYIPHRECLRCETLVEIGEGVRVWLHEAKDNPPILLL